MRLLVDIARSAGPVMHGFAQQQAQRFAVCGEVRPSLGLPFLAHTRQQRRSKYARLGQPVLAAVAETDERGQPALAGAKIGQSSTNDATRWWCTDPQHIVAPLSVESCSKVAPVSCLYDANINALTDPSFR